MFDRLDSYNRIHGAAHRRGAPAIGAPAITRQLVVTCEHEYYVAENNPSDTEHPKHTKRHYTFLDWQARSLEKAFLQIAEDFSVPDVDPEEANTFTQVFL